MKTKYGLDQCYIDHVLRLPPKSKIKIFDVQKIVNSRKKLSTCEKIEHLKDLKKTLLHRLKLIERGVELKGFSIESYKEYRQRIY